MPKNAETFHCQKCLFTCSKKSNFDIHLSTAKHKKIHSDIITIKPLSKFSCCNCGKEYNFHSGLWRHKQKCDVLKEDKITSTPVESPPIDSALIVELLKQNKELHEMVIELAKNTNNTTNNTINNTTNNKFNLNVYLNETCKDAINLNDFIQSIELNINDFINTGEVGYVKGISSIMVDRIRDMEPNIRPIHCTDLKRETVYVKDSDKWAKEDENKTHLRKAVRIIADKNRTLVHPWIQENPNYEILDTPECNKYFEYTKASLGGYGKEEDLKFENKIINNILKETVIDKNLLTN
jgi:hypothetical protein